MSYAPTQQVTIKYNRTGKETVMQHRYADILVRAQAATIVEAEIPAISDETVDKAITQSPATRMLTPKKKPAARRKPPVREQTYQTKATTKE